MPNNPTILITGGHFSPALAVCEELKEMHPVWHIFWVGRKYALEGSKVPSPEFSLVTSMDIPFINLTTGRLQRSLTLYTIPSLLKFPIGLIQSMRILRIYKPSIIVSFGGYIALPVSIAAYLRGVPVITHEQTHRPGLANVIIGALARKVCVTFPHTLPFVPKGKGVVTGLPIRREIFSPPATPSFSVPHTNLPLLYITGGSTGAQSLNEKLFPLIPELVKHMIIIHQTGNVSFQKALDVKKECQGYASQYIIAPFFTNRDVSWIYSRIFLVIGRAGANTVAELSELKKQSILIPLPWAGGDEQQKNAEYLERLGLAKVMKQEDVTPDRMKELIRRELEKGKKPPRPRRVFAKTPAELLVGEIESCLTSYAGT